MNTRQGSSSFRTFFIILVLGALLFSRLVKFLPFLCMTCGDNISTTPAFAINVKEIYKNPMTPAFGNANGNVTIIEYYDYQCTYTKAIEPEVEMLLNDKNVKIIYKDFPKLGPHSAMLAAATLASQRQGMDKYLKLHQALLQRHASYSTEYAFFELAGSIGLDVDQLKKDMKDPAITKQIQTNIAVGKSIGVSITPTFVIGGYFDPGARKDEYEHLLEMVAQARSNQ